MKYIIQLNTGTLSKCSYQVEDIIKRLDYITSKLDVSMVIFGWYQDKTYNEILCNYLKQKNIPSIFKLPIFSEITSTELEDAYIYYKDELNQMNTHFYQNDKFDFVCPSSSKNIKFILNIFDEIDKDVCFDGVFFDRIRYPAPSVKETSIYGCLCDNCKKLYKAIDFDKITSFKPLKRVGFHYKYEDSNADKLMEIKRNVITSQVKELSSYLKSKNKIIGIDTFSLNLADFVGQDLFELSKYVDFIKPMNYLKTDAPAGIPYEFNGFNKETKDAINKLWNNDYNTIESSKEMAKELLSLNNRIAIGIDANFVAGICSADTTYVLNHVKALEEVGIKEVVLSWNSMLLTSELIDELAKLNK